MAKSPCGHRDATRRSQLFCPLPRHESSRRSAKRCLQEASTQEFESHAAFNLTIGGRERTNSKILRRDLPGPSPHCTNPPEVAAILGQDRVGAAEWLRADAPPWPATRPATQGVLWFDLYHSGVRPFAARHASCSATNPSAASSTPAQAVHSRRETWWLGLSAAPIQFPAPIVRWASGTCAAMASIPSGASRKSTASCPSAGHAQVAYFG